MRWSIVLSLVASIHTGAAFASTTLLPAADWTIDRDTDATASEPACIATADFQWFPSAGLTWDVAVVRSRSGGVRYRMDLRRPLPPWWQARVGNGQDTAVWQPARFQVSIGGQSLAATGRVRGTSQEIAFAADQPFLETLARSPEMTVTVVGEARGIDTAVPNARALLDGLTRCTTSGPRTPGTTPAIRRAEDRRPTMERLREAAARIDAGGDATGRLAAVLRLGVLQARAGLWSQARTTLEKVPGRAPPAPAMRAMVDEARRQLALVQLSLEDIDGAMDTTRGTGSATEIDALAAVERGGLSFGREGMERVLLADMAVSPGDRPLRAVETMHCIGLPDLQRRLVRAHLLEWARAMTGAERLMLDRPARSAQRPPSNPAAYTLADLALGCIAPDRFIAVDATPDELGRTALLRAASLRRGHALRGIDTDLAFARAQFANASDRSVGLLEVRLESVRLDADLGRDVIALDAATALLADVEADVGTASALWLETAITLTELGLRLDRASDAQQLATRAIEVALRALPPDHSLTLRLRRLRAEAFDQDGDATAAIDALTTAIRATTRTADEVAQNRRYPVAAVRDERRMLMSDAERMTKRLDPQPAAAFGATYDDFIKDQVATLKPGTIDGRSVDFVVAPSDTLIAMLRDRDSSIDEALRSKMVAFGHVSPLDKSIDQAIPGWLDPRYTLPTELMSFIAAGDDTAIIERIVGAYRADPQSTTMVGERVEFELQLAQALSRGTVYSQLALRLLGRLRTNDANAAADAVAANIAAVRERRAVRSALRLDARAADASHRVDATIEHRYFDVTLDHGELIDRLVHAFDGSGRGMLQNALGASYAGSDFGLTTAALKRVLGDGEAVVVWIPLERSTDVLVVTRDRDVVRTLPYGRAALASRVRPLRRSIVRAQATIARGGRVTLAEYPQAMARDLGNMLFGPIDRDLASIRHLYVAQLGPTGDLPLAMLMVDGGDRPGWVGDRFAITRMPALISPFAFSSQHGAAYRSDLPLLAFGNPQGSETVIAGAGRGGPASIALADIDALPALPNAAREAEKVAKILQVHDPDRAVFLGARATRDEALRQLAGRKLSVLLFATHGLTADSRGLDEPALVMSPGSSPLPEDRLLRFGDIARLDFDVDLAILSACSTTVASDDAQEALTGLSAAFLAGGAREVLATYWTLYDDVAADIVGTIVDGSFTRKLPIAEALRQARLALTAPGVAAHPVYWASFEVLGFPRAPDTPASSPRSTAVSQAGTNPGFAAP